MKMKPPIRANPLKIPMWRIFTIIMAVICLSIVVHGSAVKAENSDAGGSVSGTISVWRTRVRTEGPRNDRDVIVYLQAIGKTPAMMTEQTVQMDQKNLLFTPHVLPVTKGTQVEFLNSDHVDHNVYLLFEKTGESIDLGTWGQGKSTRYRFNEGGVTIVLCKLHLEMAAYIVTMETPFFVQAALDEKTQSGGFDIENVPSGSYILNAWHKKLKIKGRPIPVTIENDTVTHADITITKAKYAK